VVDLLNEDAMFLDEEVHDDVKDKTAEAHYPERFSFSFGIIA
jgi:hypothetical protein